MCINVDSENLKRVQALTGAKNHSIVLNDADLDHAQLKYYWICFWISWVNVAWHASVVAVQEDVADEFIEN